MVKAISGLRYINQNSFEVDKNPEYYYGRIIWGTSSVKLNDYGSGKQLLIENGAPYTIFGFTPGMTIKDVQKNFAQRSDIKKGKTYTYSNDLKVIEVTPKIKMIHLVDYLELRIRVYYDPKTEVVKLVEFDYFQGD